MVMPMTTQSDALNPNYGESFVSLGWEVDRGHEPRYWLEQDAKPGGQSRDALVRIPARLMATHTAIIAQSGSGKSFFLGRLIEELVLQTSANCLILDPNADFRRIPEAENERLWTEAKYDRAKRKGTLPDEASRDAFTSRWSMIRMRV